MFLNLPTAILRLVFLVATLAIQTRLTFAADIAPPPPEPTPLSSPTPLAAPTPAPIEPPIISNPAPEVTPPSSPVVTIPAPAAEIPQYKVLLVIKKSTDVADSSCANCQLKNELSADDIDHIAQDFQKTLPSLVASWSANEVNWVTDVVISSEVLKNAAVSDGRIKTLPRAIIEKDLATAAKPGSYDSIFYYYIDQNGTSDSGKVFGDKKDIHSYTFLSHAGAVTVVPYQSARNFADNSYFNQWMIRNWIEQLELIYRSRVTSIPKDGIAANDTYGFSEESRPGFSYFHLVNPNYLKKWYTAYLQGNPVGLGPSVWNVGTPRTLTIANSCALSGVDAAQIATFIDELKAFEPNLKSSDNSAQIARLNQLKSSIEEVQSYCPQDSLIPEALFLLSLNYQVMQETQNQAHDIRTWLRRDYPVAPQVAELNRGTLEFKHLVILKKTTAIEPATHNHFTNSEISDLTRIWTMNEPALVYLYSRGQVKWTVSVSVSETPLTHVSIYHFQDKNSSVVVDGVNLVPSDVDSDLKLFTSAANPVDGVFYIAKTKDEITGLSVTAKGNNSFDLGGTSSAYFTPSYQGFTYLPFSAPEEVEASLDLRQSAIHEWMHQLEPMYDGLKKVQIPDDTQAGFQYGIHDNKGFGYSWDDKSSNPRYWQRWYSDLLTGSLVYPTQPERGHFGFGPSAWAYGNFTTTKIGRGKNSIQVPTPAPTPIKLDFLKKFAPQPPIPHSVRKTN